MSGLYAEVKSGSGIPIVLLHGFGATSAIWRPVIERLEGRNIVAYDLPGHGRSLNYPNAGSPGTAAKAISADLAERKIGGVHMVGHSMGGAIATLISLMNPDLSASLTLLSPGGYGPEINALLLRRYGSAADADTIADCLKEMSGPDAEIPDEVATDRANERQSPGQTAMLEKIAALITRDGRQGVIPRESIQSFNIPVAVLWGTHDTVLPISHMDTMPLHWTKISLEGAGHMLVEEAPDRVAELIARQAES